MMASSAETAADENTNESPMAHGAVEEIVATMAGIIDKLQQVAVGVGAAHPSYAVSKFDGVSEDVEMWLQKFKRHARLQYLHTENYVDAFAFHVTGVAETWFLTLPASQQASWEGLRAACRERFARSQHGRWRQERDLYSMKQQPGQNVASFAADVLQAARGVEMTEAQLVRLVLGGLHEKVTPIVEMSQPETVEDLLRCPVAANGMTAPYVAMERNVMAYTKHNIGPTDNGSDCEEQVPSNAMTLDYAPGRTRRQRYGGTAGYESNRAEREAPRMFDRDGGYGPGRRGQQQFIPAPRVGNLCFIHDTLGWTYHQQETPVVRRQETYWDGPTTSRKPLWLALFVLLMGNKPMWQPYHNTKTICDFPEQISSLFVLLAVL